MLESTTAVFPRIVIDTDLMSRVSENGQIWRDYLRRGEDGVYFIDYLFGSYLDRWSYPQEYSLSADEILKEHKATIEARLAELGKGTEFRKRQKVIWMAQYHNSTIVQLRDRFGDKLPRTHFSGTEIDEELFRY